jgi:cellulose synthase/poly-beta-1,6-N-acetylglucosamine synthase-like glycosyltransferase
VLLLFASSLALLLYTYVGFPLALWAASTLLAPRRPAVEPAASAGGAAAAVPGAEAQAAPLPSVSVLVAAYNEERHVVARLQNLAALHYPTQQLEILLGSDGSSDRTVQLARSLGLQNLQVLDAPRRQGKIAVLNRLASHARGQILAFTDANTLWAPDALGHLVRHFADPSVGGVSGRLRLTPAGADTRLEGSYWDLESTFKEWESRLGTTIGANGAIYAIRAALYRLRCTGRCRRTGR